MTLGIHGHPWTSMDIKTLSSVWIFIDVISVGIHRYAWLSRDSSGYQHIAMDMTWSPRMSIDVYPWTPMAINGYLSVPMNNAEVHVGAQFRVAWWQGRSFFVIDSASTSIRIRLSHIVRHARISPRFWKLHKLLGTNSYMFQLVNKCCKHVSMAPRSIPNRPKHFKK